MSYGDAYFFVRPEYGTCFMLALCCLGFWGGLSFSWKFVDTISHRCDIIITAFTINLLKPTGYVMHQQFNIQQLYALPTLYLCVLYVSENKQRLVPLTS